MSLVKEIDDLFNSHNGLCPSCKSANVLSKVEFEQSRYTFDEKNVYKMISHYRCGSCGQWWSSSAELIAEKKGA